MPAGMGRIAKAVVTVSSVTGSGIIASSYRSDVMRNRISCE